MVGKCALWKKGISNQIHTLSEFLGSHATYSVCDEDREIDANPYSSQEDIRLTHSSYIFRDETLQYD